jgi:hypothetical protein
VYWILQSGSELVSVVVRIVCCANAPQKSSWRETRESSRKKCATALSLSTSSFAITRSFRNSGRFCPRLNRYVPSPICTPVLTRP